MAVGALQAALGFGQPALGQHLARLRGSGVVETRRAGQTIYYRQAGAEIEQIMAALYESFCKPR